VIALRKGGGTGLTMTLTVRSSVGDAPLLLIIGMRTNLHLIFGHTESNVKGVLV